MEVVKQEIFSDLDFSILLFSIMKKNNINRFSKNELETDLYYYSQNPKYAPLFLDIDSRNKRIDLSEAITMQMMFGSIISLEPNLDTKYIVDQDYEINNYQEKLKLVEELVEEYILRKEVAKKSSINLKIYGIDPNNSYSLVYGEHRLSRIEWNLVTDAKCISMDEKVERINLSGYFSDPSRNNHSICLKSSELLDVSIDDSTFALLQGKVDDKVKSAILYSECLDKDVLEKISSYALLGNQTNDSNIKILTLKK